MVVDYMRDYLEAKYHFATAKRMFKSYYDFEEKRFLVGVINEAARSVSSLVKAYLIFEGILGKNSKKNLKIFMDRVSVDYLDSGSRINLFKILEVERAQKKSPIEFSRKDKIILLINGKYRFLTVSRIGEFLDSIEGALKAFPGWRRQV